MSRPQNLEWFLRTAFTTPQLLRWVDGITAEPIVDELPGGSSSHADIAHAVVKELRRRGVRGDIIFNSLTHERPLLADELETLRRHWPAPAIPEGARRRVPRILTAAVTLGILASFAAWNWPTTLTSEQRALRITSPELFTLPTPLAVIPFTTRPPTRPVSTPLRVVLQDCHESGCTDASLAGTPRFCNPTTCVLQLTALQPSFVSFVTLLDDRWILADTRLDLQLHSAIPVNARLHVFTTKVNVGPISETVVALAFRDAATRKAYRQRFGAQRPGPDFPTPAAIGMPDTPWEEAHFDYEIDPSCP